MQLCNGDDFGLSQPNISRIISQFLNAITALCIVKRFIKFPTTDAEVRGNQIGFHGIAGFPGVVGVIDGTQIRIVAPSEHEADYVNRKNFHSINVQTVFDHTHKVIDLVAKWPGSTHDARILRQSGLYACFESKSVNRNPHLLGDSGYSAKQWLLMPYLHPQAGQQFNYNSAFHTRETRCVVERGIGQLKRRFHALHGEIRLNPAKACKVVVACGILHNLCQLKLIPFPDDDGDVDDNHDDDDDSNQNDDEYGGNDAQQLNGAMYRRHITETYF